MGSVPAFPKDEEAVPPELAEKYPGLPLAFAEELRRIDEEVDALMQKDVAMRSGFWQLGRFATEYRQLFEERPSETLARPARSA